MHAEFPDLQEKGQKAKAHQGGDPVEGCGQAQRIGPIEQAQGGVVADAGNGDDKSEETAKPGAINLQRYGSP